MSHRNTGHAGPIDDASKDTVDDLRPVSGRPQPIDRTDVQPIATLDDDHSGIEANIILIAHPENRALGKRYRLGPGSSMELGRSPSSDICLSEVPSVSRRHARLEHRGAEVVIEDLKSTNGTWVNDHRIDGPMRLRSGDRFQVGAGHFKLLHERDVEHAYHEAIHNMMVRDGLTQIFNRRKFDEEAEREVVRALRYGRPLALVFFDIDRFKAVNDKYGHVCGDHVLKLLVMRVKAVLRAEQLFARVGGEEFGVLCPETPAAAASALAERLRQTIAGEPIRFSGHELSITCSFGVAELHPDHGGVEDFYAAADRAMYASKNAGRNAVTVATSRSV